MNALLLQAWHGLRKSLLQQCNVGLLCASFCKYGQSANKLNLTSKICNCFKARLLKLGRAEGLVPGRSRSLPDFARLRSSTCSGLPSPCAVNVGSNQRESIS